MAFVIVSIASARSASAAASVTLVEIEPSPSRRSRSARVVALWASRIWSGTLRFSARSSSDSEAPRRLRDAVLQLDVRAVLDRLEEVLAALLGLGHDHADVLAVVAKAAIRARLEAAPKADHQQDQEADAQADRDQAAHQELLSLSLRPAGAPRGALRRQRGSGLFFLVEECHGAEV